MSGVLLVITYIVGMSTNVHLIHMHHLEIYQWVILFGGNLENIKTCEILQTLAVLHYNSYYYGNILMMSLNSLSSVTVHL